MTLNPHTWPIEGDLSREDVRVLYDLCHANDVVEFGSGGSTILLAQIALRLTSYEQSREWQQLVRRRLAELENTCEVHLRFCEDLPKPHACHVLFVDGLRTRPEWVRMYLRERLARRIIIHDSRRVHGFADCFEWPLNKNIESVDFHRGNMIVIHVREKPVEYENWNITEPNEGRQNLAQRYGVTVSDSTNLRLSTPQGRMRQRRNR